MLACLFAMLFSFSNEPPQVGRQVEKPATQSYENSPAVRPRVRQRSIFGPDDPTPDFQLHPEVNDESVSSVNSDVGVDASESTIGILASAESDDATEADSFFTRYWPYALIVVVLVGWLVSKLRLMQAPSFRHHVISERKKSETRTNLKGEFKASKRFQRNSNSDDSDADEISAVGKTELEPQLDQDEPKLNGQFKVASVLKTTNQDEPQLNQDEPHLDQGEPKLKGQFKVATRFQKPKKEKAASSIDQETSRLKATANGDKSSVGAKPDVQQPVDMSGDRPADDEFEFDDFNFNDFDDEYSASGSVVLSEEERAKILEAAEILAAVGKRKIVADDSRFK